MNRRCLPTRMPRLGFFTSATWAPDFPNPRSKKFVTDFEAAYGYVPGTYAAHSYDAAALVDSAMRGAGGK